MKPETHSGTADQLAAKVVAAARVIVTLSLLLTLMAGNIAWSTGKSGPVCMLACCVGRVTHAAGSCFDGYCQTSGLKKGPPGSLHHFHHHSEQLAEQSDPNVPQTFAGAVASAGGVNAELVPTIDAAADARIYERPVNGISPASSEQKTSGIAVSAAVISRPCLPECGAGGSGFGSPKRSRNAAIAESNHLPSPSAINLANEEHVLTNTRAAFGRESAPRGPPVLLSP